MQQIGENFGIRPKLCSVCCTGWRTTLAGEAAAVEDQSSEHRHHLISRLLPPRALRPC